jgi:hypothetical protein
MVPALLKSQGLLPYKHPEHRVQVPRLCHLDFKFPLHVLQLLLNLFHAALHTGDVYEKRQCSGLLRLQNSSAASQLSCSFSLNASNHTWILQTRLCFEVNNPPMRLRHRLKLYSSPFRQLYTLCSWHHQYFIEGNAKA